MKEKWVVSAKKADFQAIGQHFGIDPVLARIMRNRGLTDLQEMNLYLHGTRADLNDPHLLKDADLAAQILREKIKEKKRIRIIGDYDIDGIQSTYILYCALRRLGADADFVIPDRILDGYGLNEHLVTRASQDGIDTILTCDNGISAIDQIHLSDARHARCIKSKGELGRINVITLDEGMRPACYLSLSASEISGGTGTLDDPYTFTLIPPTVMED